MSVNYVQPDLFGAEDARQAEIDAWRARFERADWVAPYDTAGGMKAGESSPGWRCPDPDCGQIEPNGYVLAINHGWWPEIPGHEPFDGRCHRIRRRLSAPPVTKEA